LNALFFKGIVKSKLFVIIALSPCFSKPVCVYFFSVVHRKTYP